MMNSGAVRDRISCGPRACAVDLHQPGADAVADAQVLLGDHLVARQHRLDAAGLDDGIAALHALDGAGDEMLLALEEVVEHLLALGVADLLQDDLLGGLGADAAEVDRLERFLDELVELRRRASPAGPRRARSARPDLDGLVGHHQPAAEGLELAGFRSISTRTSASSLVRFFVAEASADSRAAKTMSRERSSRAPGHPPTAAIHGSSESSSIYQNFGTRRALSTWSSSKPVQCFIHSQAYHFNPALFLQASQHAGEIALGCTSGTRSLICASWPAKRR
jgi:hypothetical protein